MSYRTLLLITLLGMAACSGGSQDPATGPATGGEEAGTAPAGEEAVPAPSWRDQRMELGLKTYRAACASCHDAGEDGAPVTGRREDWAAGEYMLEKTFPELPKG